MGRARDARRRPDPDDRAARSFDGSVRWNVTIMADSGLYAGRLGRELASEIYPSMDMPTAGSFNPPGRAEEVPEGFKLSGRWRFGTGIRNADRVLGRFQRYVDGEPAVDENGTPTCGSRGSPPRWCIAMTRGTPRASPEAAAVTTRSTVWSCPRTRCIATPISSAPLSTCRR